MRDHTPVGARMSARVKQRAVRPGPACVEVREITRVGEAVGDALV